MSMSLKELGEDIKKMQAVASMDPGDNYSTRRMRLGDIAQAKERLRLLGQEYRKELISRAAFAIVTGSQAEKFATLAEAEFSCFSVNVEDFYTEITSKIPPVLYQGVSSSQNLFDHIAQAVEEKARTLEIDRCPALIFESKYKKMLNNKEEMVKLTKTAVNDKIGAEFVGLDALYKVTQKVIDSELSGKIVPIILVVDDLSLVEELSKGLKRSISRNTFIVSTGSKVDQKLKDISLDVTKSVSSETVEKTLLKMKEKLA